MGGGFITYDYTTKFNKKTYDNAYYQANKELIIEQQRIRRQSKKNGRLIPEILFSNATLNQTT